MSSPADRRTIMVTGASSGIGKAAAVALAAQGFHVIAHGRDPERLATAKRDIISAAAPGGRVDTVCADLALMADTARMADDVSGLTDRIDVLIANAGGVRDRMVITSEGHEATFAGNHLGHFLLTRKLMPLLLRATEGNPPGAVRIVSTSSSGHAAADPIDWDDLEMKKNWVSGRAYCRAKLCNVLFTRELARRVATNAMAANVMHPGVVATNFVTHATAEMRDYMNSLDAQPPETGADTLVWLATAPEAGKVSGRYFHQREIVPHSPLADDEATARRLWEESERLIAGY